MLTNDIIAKIRILVNDIHKERWEDDTIVQAFIDEAICEAYTIAPEKFLSTMVVKLNKGSMQRVCCGKLYKINFVSDADGNKVSSIKSSSLSNIGLFTSKCKSSAPNTYAMTNKAGEEFIVDPPVSSDDVYVNATVSVKPDSNSLDCSVEPAIVDYVAYRLLSTEHESQHSSTKAKAFSDSFYTRLGMHYKVKQRELKEAKNE